MVVDYNRANRRLLYVVGFLYFAVSNLSRMLQHAGIPREATYVLFMALLAVYFAKNLRAFRTVDFVYYAVVGSVAGLGLMKYASFIGSQLDIFAVLGLFLPAYLFFRFFSRHENILSECVTAAGWFSAVYLLPYYVFVIRGNVDYSMPYAYWVSFPICVLYHRFFETRRWLCLGGSILLYATLVLIGCRGALLLTTLLCLYTTLDAARRYRWRWTSGRILCLLGSLAFVTLLALSMDSMLAFLAKFSETSRNIHKLFEGNYLESTTRDAIYQTCQQWISDRPGGYGPLASRQLLLWDNYPHSLWYELQLDFGVLIGISLFCFLWFITLYNMYAYRDSKLSIMVNYMAIVGMGSLMRSSSYYYEIYVPAMCGLFVSRLMDARRMRVRGPARHMEIPPSAGLGRTDSHAR